MDDREWETHTHVTEDGNFDSVSVPVPVRKPYKLPPQTMARGTGMKIVIPPQANPLRPGYYHTNTGKHVHITERAIHWCLSSYDVLPDGSDDTAHGMTGWFEDGSECHDENEHLLLNTWQACPCHPVLTFILTELGHRDDAYGEYCRANFHVIGDRIKKEMLAKIEAQRATLDYHQQLIESL